MHHSFIAIETQLIADSAATGGSFIFSTASMNNVAQGAAVIAVLLLTKNDKLKSICSASGISALLGITEPAMFGVTLKLKYPFYAAMIGSAAGSAYLAGTRTLAQALGAAGLPGFISMKPDHYMNFALGLMISMGISFLLTVVFWKRYRLGEGETCAPGAVTAPAAATAPADATAPTPSTPEILYAPMRGQLLSIERADDEAFAAKMLGDGVAVNPCDGTVCAPCDGTVSLVFPTKHAVGLTTDRGTDVLIHVGINTVSLDGRGFTAYVAQGDRVKKGDCLLQVDLDLVRREGCSPQTMMILPQLSGARVTVSEADLADLDTEAICIER